MTISKEQIEAALSVLDSVKNAKELPSQDIINQTSKTIRAVLQERLDDWKQLYEEHLECSEYKPKPQPSEALAALEDMRSLDGHTVDAIHELQGAQQDIALWYLEHKETIRAALQSNDVPQGFVLVPIEPTREMTKAIAPYTTGRKSADGFGDTSLTVALAAYKAMIAAAPKPTGE